MPVRVPRQPLSVNLILQLAEKLICKIIIFMDILKNIKYQSLFMDLIYFAVPAAPHYCQCYIYLSLFCKYVQ